MPTVDASQFTTIKRYQANINGSLGANPLKFRVPSFFGGYTPSYRIGFLPPNAIISNKEIIAPPISEESAPPQSQRILINSSNFANGELLEPLSFSSRSEINFIFSVNLGSIPAVGKFVMSNSGDKIKTIKFTQENITQLYEENPPNGIFVLYYDLNNTYDTDIVQNTIDFSNDVYIDVTTENPITSISNIRVL
jgi:hypothetical protein